MTESNKRSFFRRNPIFSGYKTEWTMLAVFLLFFIGMSFASPFFNTSQNLLNVLSQVSLNAIMAIGMTLVILTAGIDLSVGSTLGLSAMVAGIVLKSSQSVLLGVGASLLIGLLIGCINGYLIGYLKIPAFIGTLGMMQICKSLTYVISDGNSQSGFPDAFKHLGKAKLFGTIPAYTLLIIALYALFIFVLTKLKFGRFLYAIGSNEEAARLSGINTKINILKAYTISGVMSAIAGLVYVSRMMAVDPTYGKDAEIDVIAAVVIGGTSMMGGKGSLWGTVIGVSLVGFLRNALNLIGLNPFWQGSAVGAVIIIAVLTEKISSSNVRKLK